MPRRPPARTARWKRILGWTAAGVAGLLVLLAIAAFALLHSSKFHAYLSRTMQAKATQSLGSSVQLRDFTLSWSGISPSITLHDLVVHGRAPYSNPPLLHADLVSVHATITSIWRRSWYVNNIQIERPVLHIFADNQGRTNLPAPPHSEKSHNKIDIFELGVRHLVLENGEAFYNNEKSNVSADLRDLDLRIAFTQAEQKYSGSISYRDGHLRVRDAVPMPHELDAYFSLTPAEFQLESVDLRTAGSRFSLSARASNFVQPVVHATYNALLDTTEVRRMLANSTIPNGTIQLSGSADYQTQPGKSFLDSARVRGRLYSAALRASGPYAVTVRDLRAEYALTNGNAQISGLHAALLGGTLKAELLVRNLSGNTRSELKSSISNISMSAIQDLAAPDSEERAHLQGSLNASAEAGWGKTFQNLVLTTRAQMSGSLQSAAGAGVIPLRAMLAGRYAALNQLLSVQPSYISTPQTQISLNGAIARSSSLHVRVQASQLHEFEALAAAIHPQANSLGLYGNLTLVATVSGSTRSPQVNGQVAAHDVRVRGTSWKLLETQFSANPSAARVSAGQLVPAGRGRINFSLDAALQRWSFAPSSEFRARVAASNLDAAELARAAGLTTPVTGTVSVNLNAHGTELNPIGDGKLELARASFADEPINRIQIKFQGNGTEIRSQIDASLPAGSANAQLNYEPRRQAYEVNLNATGIKLDQIQAIKKKNLQLSGVLNATASGNSTLNDPGLQLKLEIPRLQIRNQVINGLILTTDVANHLAKLDLASDVLDTHAEGRGTVQLTGNYPADFSFDTRALPLQPLFAMYIPAQAGNLSGQTELHATLHGPLKEKSQMVAHLEVPKLVVDYKKSIHLEAAQPIRADYNAGTLDVKRSTIRGTGTELTFQANVPAAKDAPASMLLQGTVDLQLAQLFSSDISSSGQLRFDINSFGRRSDPNIQGQVRIVNASFAEVGMPLGLRDGNGVLTLTRNRLEVTQFSGQAGGGTVSASGGLQYRPDLRFDLGLKAEGVRVLYEQSVRTTLNSNLALTGGYDSALLRGQVNVEDVSFTPSFDLMEVAGSLGGGEATPPPTGGFEDSLRLNIAVQTPSGISPSSRTVSISGTANLTLRGTAAQPVLLGRINLNDGELIFRGNRYLVQSGTIEFRNPSRTEPIIDISANTSISQYQVQMRFWGPADHLHTNYASDPALPPSDIINLIAFGKTSEAAAANPTPPGSLGAESLIASQVSSQVTNRIEKLAGISQLSIDPVLGSSQQSPGARIAIQQRVTSKIYVTYSTDLTATQQQAIKLEYQMNRRASFSAVRDQNGGFSFETTFRKRW